MEVKEGSTYRSRSKKEAAESKKRKQADAKEEAAEVKAEEHHRQIKRKWK